MHQYKELIVWQKAIELAKRVYEETAMFPKEEKYGLTSQVNRSVVSVASNIAEGAGRSSDKEFHHFLSIAAGSMYELETQIILAKEFNYIEQINFEKLTVLIVEIQKLIYGLQKKLSNN